MSGTTPNDAGTDRPERNESDSACMRSVDGLIASAKIMGMLDAALSCSPPPGAAVASAPGDAPPDPIMETVRGYGSDRERHGRLMAMLDVQSEFVRLGMIVAADVVAGLYQTARAAE